MTTRRRVERRFPPSARVSRPPLSIRPGDGLTVLERDAEWPAFVFVQNDLGQRGWVPDRMLSRSGARATALQEYDTTTLDPGPGQVVEVLEEDAEVGWCWCRDANGALGWFPRNHLSDANVD